MHGHSIKAWSRVKGIQTNGRVSKILPMVQGLGQSLFPFPTRMYEQIVQTLVYINEAEEPMPSPRLVTIMAFDGKNLSCLHMLTESANFK